MRVIIYESGVAGNDLVGLVGPLSKASLSSTPLVLKCVSPQ